MEDLALKVFVRPFVLLALLALAYFVGKGVNWLIPAGRVKSLLNRPIRLQGQAENATVMWCARILFVLVVLTVIFKPFSLLR